MSKYSFIADGLKNIQHLEQNKQYQEYKGPKFRIFLFLWVSVKTFKVHFILVQHNRL